MSFEGSPINQKVHKQQFVYDFGENIRAHKLLQRIPTASSWNMYRVDTSRGERIACLGIVIPGNITRILTLGFDATGEIVGFSHNVVSLSPIERQKLLSHGTIGSSKTGAEYGTAMEVVRQHELSLYARRTGMPIEHTVQGTTQRRINRLEEMKGFDPETDSKLEHWQATQGAWENLYSKKTYGYTNNRRRYLPTEERIVPEATWSSGNTDL